MPSVHGFDWVQASEWGEKRAFQEYNIYVSGISKVQFYPEVQIIFEGYYLDIDNTLNRGFSGLGYGNKIDTFTFYICIEP